MKACTRCGELKSLDAFSLHKLGKFGRRPRCRECSKIENAEYRARTVKQRAAYNKRYRQENREHHLEYNKAWNKANRDRCDVAVKAWRKRNPEKAAAIKSRFRARRRKAFGANYTTNEKAVARAAFYAGRCYYCFDTADTTDHRIPVSRGGPHLPANLVPACRSCNSSKNDRTEFEYLRR